MNERIQELVNKTNDLMDKNYPSWWWGPQSFYQSIWQEKFAELIIKECLGDLKERIALRYQGSEKDRDIGYGMEIVYFDIIDKFGVKS